MLESGKITPGQAGLLMMFTVLGTANLVMPALTSRYAQTDAWMTIILSFLPHVLLIMVIYRIGQTFSQESMVCQLRKITGKFLGAVVTLGYIWYLVYSTAVITRTVSEFLLTVFMPDTPIEMFIIVMLFLGASVIRSGLEVLARAAIFIAPIFFASFGLIFVLLIGEIELSNLTPFLEHGFTPVLQGTIYPTIWRGNFILMLIIWPYLNKPEQAFKSMMQAAVIIVMVVLPITVASTAIFGPLVSYLRFPTFELAEYIDLAGFITRLDAVFMAVWIGGAFIKIGVYYYCLCLMFSEFFGLKEYRCTVYPFGIIVGALVIFIAPNMAVFDNLFTSVLVPLNLIFEFIVPCGLLGLIYLRGLHKSKRGETNGHKQA